MLWLVSRTDGVDYDEYDAWVVRGADADEAVRAVWDAHGGNGDGWSIGHARTLDVFRSRVTVVDVTPFGDSGAPEIILGSFNAG